MNLEKILVGGMYKNTLWANWSWLAMANDNENSITIVKMYVNMYAV